MTDVVIIGAGISGLSCGHFISKKTNNFLILESKDKLGGIIQTNIEKNYICEYGPNTVLLNKEATKQINSECKKLQRFGKAGYTFRYLSFRLRIGNCRSTDSWLRNKNIWT